MNKLLLIFFVFIFLIFALPLKTLDTWMSSDIRLDTGDTPGATTSQYPKIACSDNHVYAVWRDFRTGGIYFNRSTDYGATWLPSDVCLASTDASPGLPQIACSGSYVYVVWPDNTVGYWCVYFNCSSDYGATWLSKEIRLDNGDTGAYEPQISCTGSDVYVVWEDYRNGSFTDIYFNFSNDNGANWQSEDTRLDTGDNAGFHDSKKPQIACSGNYVYAVWYDGRHDALNHFDIYLNYSTANGEKWQASDIRLDTGDTPGWSTSHFPQISTSGSHVYAVWMDERNGSPDIYFNYSNDYGATWQSSDIRLDTDLVGYSSSTHPQITSTGANVYVVWIDQRNGDPDIYFNYSSDYGVNWQSTDIRLDTGDTAGANDSLNPHIAFSGSHVYVVWNDNRNGGSYSDIYFNCSNDNGATWRSSDIRLDTGDPAGTNSSSDPRVASTGNHVFAVWHDLRNGSADIYFNRAIPLTDIKANGSDGPISISQSDTLQIRVSLTSNGLSSDVDYWLAYKGPSGWVHYINTTKKWESGLGVTHQGPLMDLNNKKVFQSKLSPGSYTFYFGVDMVMDGKVTKSSLYKDEVQVTVTQ